MILHFLNRTIVFLFVATLFFAAPCARANESAMVTDLAGVRSVEVIKELDLTILHLENGMTVCLKTTEDEDEEVIVRLVAMGGFAALPPLQRASAQLAPKTALKSGIGEYTYDQLQSQLYQHSIEFSVAIHPFCRTIDAAADPQEVETLFSLVNKFFTERKFDKNAFDHVIAKAGYNLRNRSKDERENFEEAFLSYNTEDFAPLRPLALTDLKHADFETADHFLHRCFSNPSDFVCLVVGRIDVSTVVPLVVKYLDSIPKHDQCFACEATNLPLLRKNGERKEVKNTPDSGESITRMTFPIQTPITEENLRNMEAMAKLVELRLTSVVAAHIKTEPALVNATLVFPFYPSLQSPWLTIQYVTDPKQAIHVERIILTQLEQLKKNGAFEAELALLKRSTAAKDYLCQKDNSYWLLALSNYYLWKWNPSEMLRQRRAIQSLSAAEMTDHLRKSLSLDSYSVVSARP